MSFGDWLVQVKKTNIKLKYENQTNNCANKKSK